MSKTAPPGQIDVSPTARKQRLFGSTQQVIRDYFRDTHALEVFPPTLVPNPGMELDILALSLQSPLVRELRGHFLHTSPEFAIKSVLHELDSDVFTIIRAYRDEVSSERHHAEFQILEWYRRDASYERLMDDVEALFVRIVETMKIAEVPSTWRPPFARLSYREAFMRFAKMDCDDRSVSNWLEAARQAGISVSEATDVDFLESVVYSELIEPALGAVGPCFIVDYPVRHAVLAKRKNGSLTTAERVEFYLPYRDKNRALRGLEIANGFSELLDPAEQRMRFERADEKLRAANMKERPMPNHVLRGIQHLSPTAGMALGVDRLTVWLAQQLYAETWAVPDLYFGAIGQTDN